MNSSLILGFFDGIHLAHKEVILSAVNFSKEHHTEPVLITFKESPALFFGHDIKYIFPREHSLKKIKDLGVKKIIEQDFSQIAEIGALEYLEYLCNKYSPSSISSGYNHTFGRNKTGNSETLEKMQPVFGYKYLCTKACKNDKNIVSSTYIKKALSDGDIETANLLLDEKFFINGTVIKGAQIGRKLGFPTANIKYPKNIIQIPFGVYAIEYEKHKGMLNWGVKPTLDNQIEPILEANIFDFNENLYDKNIQIKFIKKIRNEKKFDSLEELKEQIKKDREECLRL